YRWPKILGIAPPAVSLQVANVDILTSKTARPCAREVQIFLIRRKTWLRVPLFRVYSSPEINGVAPSLGCYIRNIDIAAAKTITTTARIKDIIRWIFLRVINRKLKISFPVFGSFSCCRHNSLIAQQRIYCAERLFKFSLPREVNGIWKLVVS